MACFYLILVLAAALDCGSTFILENAAHKSIKWPKEYHLRGEEDNYLSGIITRFETWYSSSTNRSRVDYNGGTVREYYTVSNSSEEIIFFKINPVASEELTNKLECREARYIELFNILPDPKNYTFKGHEMYNEKLVDIWKYVEEKDKDEKKSEKTLYVYQQDGEDIPVYEEIKKHNLWTGAVDEHKVKRFYDFKKPTVEALDHHKEKTCNESLLTVLDSTMNYELLSNDEDEFNRYIIRHNKKYSEDEHEIRKQIFKDNMRRVIRHNQQNLGYKLTLNKFSDRTHEELAYLRGALPSLEHVGSVPFPHSEEEVELMARELPTHYDMRTEGFITSVKNQAECGSCWAFATVAAVEGAIARHNGGRNLDLSEQSLVDCAGGFDSYGCDGGFMEGTFKYVLKHGIPSEMEYGLYLSKENWCHLRNMTSVHKIKGFAAVPLLSVNAMKVALYKYGPVTVTINANDNVDVYHSGIFYDPTCNKRRMNHAVTVVGYGQREGVDYWIVKNSWGEDWGEDGYILFSATNNNCHILEGAYYPVV
ncbi:digestive cysteine proteinase 1 [Bicyclus anynana]|uniref:Digestive cysteine proteinase 1 n=1 Tax=Bicyclus anynana TaxID=110368 RepID=A0ABM3LSA8_BICAN|nr:digestive cysteine proteinase 1 [Bicyclus anynana]